MKTNQISSEIPGRTALAEVTESSLHTFTAQCWEREVIPPFGSLVTIVTPERTLFGLVHAIKTGSMDSSRYPFPFKKTEEELRNEQPQIFDFLTTAVTCITLGYLEKGQIFYLASPEPAKMHANVQPATQDQYQRFFSSSHYLHLIFNQASLLGSVDELLLALLKNLKNRGLLTKETTSSFLETFALLTGNDYRHIKLFLQRAQGILT